MSRARCRSQCGYTLIEVIISTALASVVAGGLAGSLYIAGQSLNGNRPTADKLAADMLLAQINRDAQTAIAFSELTSRSVHMTVPDRTGDGQADNIRYEWSGVAGEPLTVSLNGADATVVAANVQNFSLSWITRLIEGVATRPIVLFVSSQSPGSDGKVTPSASEQLRIDLLDAWGFDAQVVGQSQSTTIFNTALTTANVAYIPATVSDSSLGSKLNAATVGVVTELLANSVRLGLTTSGNGTLTSSRVLRSDTSTHYITYLLPSGDLTIAGSNLSLNTLQSAIDYDAVKLMSAQGSTWRSSLLAIETGGELATGAAAPGRRVLLPWGSSSFDFAALNSIAQTIMRRSLEWAAGAASVEATGVRLETFSQTIASSNVQSLSAGIPAGTVAGNLLVLAVALDGSPSNLQLGASGWTNISSANQSGQVTLAVWWKIAGSSESNIPITWQDNEQAFATVMRFSGNHLTTPINTTAVAGGTSSAPNSPAVSTTVEKCLVLRLGGFDGGGITAGSTGLSNNTSIYMDRSSILLGIVSAGGGYAMRTTTGSASSKTFALTASEEWRTVTIAIAPAPEVTQ